MDTSTLEVLLRMAASVGVIHTLSGPDHYIPFIAMARVGGWSMPKTIFITLVCGVGHVMSSVLIGALGIGMGWAVGNLEIVEGHRGDVAGWLLCGFGLAYLAWGVRQAIRNRPHSHIHVHTDGTVHLHEHTHQEEHLHVHATAARASEMTPWILFAIFVFGPCEALIPILMYPAAQLSLPAILLVTVVFMVATLATMTAIVVTACLGLSPVRLHGLERYSHAAAGLAITLCGAAIQIGL